MHNKFTYSARLLFAVLLFLFPLTGKAAQCFCLKSASPEHDFMFKMELPDEDRKKGTVQYKGGREQLNIVFKGSEELERHEGRPSYIKYTWNEVYKGKVTGVYVLCIQGANIYDSWYARARDHKMFKLERVLLEDECHGCF